MDLGQLVATDIVRERDCEGNQNRHRQAQQASPSPTSQLPAKEHPPTGGQDPSRVGRTPHEWQDPHGGQDPPQQEAAVQAAPGVGGSKRSGKARDSKHHRGEAVEAPTGFPLACHSVSYNSVGRDHIQQLFQQIACVLH